MFYVCIYIYMYCRHHNGVFVLGVVSGSPADQSDMLQKGDHLLEINGMDMRHSSVDMVAQTLMDASGDVTLVVERLQAGGLVTSSRSDLTCECHEGKMREGGRGPDEGGTVQSWEEVDEGEGRERAG